MKNPPDPLELDNDWTPSASNEAEAPAARRDAVPNAPAQSAAPVTQELKSDIRSAPLPKPSPARPAASPAAPRPKPPPLPRSGDPRPTTPTFPSAHSQAGPRARPAPPKPAQTPIREAQPPMVEKVSAPEPVAVPPAQPPAARESERNAWFDGLLQSDSAIEKAEPELRTAQEAPAPVAREQTSQLRPLARPLERSVCAFWIGSGCFAIDTELVGEVVSVSAMIPVPLAPKAVLGLFNLRGTPVPIVDLAGVLSLPGAARARPEQAGFMALVLRSKGLHAAALIDKMEAVLAASGGRYVEPSHGSDHQAVKGFVELLDRKGVVATLLDSRALIEHFERLTFSRTNRARSVSQV